MTKPQVLGSNPTAPRIIKSFKVFIIKDFEAFFADFYGPDRRVSNIFNIKKSIEDYIVRHPQDEYAKYDMTLCFKSRWMPYLMLYNRDNSEIFHFHYVLNQSIIILMTKKLV